MVLVKIQPDSILVSEKLSKKITTCFMANNSLLKILKIIDNYFITFLAIQLITALSAIFFINEKLVSINIGTNQEIKVRPHIPGPAGPGPDDNKSDPTKCNSPIFEYCEDRIDCGICNRPGPCQYKGKTGT